MASRCYLSLSDFAFDGEVLELSSVGRSVMAVTMIVPVSGVQSARGRKVTPCGNLLNNKNVNLMFINNLPNLDFGLAIHF
jgi:hypothetical protein